MNIPPPILENFIHEQDPYTQWRLATYSDGSPLLVCIWYVSNISIIFDCSMLLYYLFWMIMGFIILFYITFGNNLLTGSPAHIAVLLPVSVFQRKGISNGVQMEWNLRERDFWNERDPGDLELKSRKLRGGHEAGRRNCPLGKPPPSWAPRGSHDRLLSPIYPHIP